MYILFISISFLFNIAALTAYGIDKYKAIHRMWRISEQNLILIAFLGPFGAMLGMFLFNHKINKLKFKVLVLLFIIIHLISYYYIH